MRAFALAAFAAMAAASIGVAEARVWSDQMGRMTIDVPRGYEQDDQAVRADAEASVALFFTPNKDCYAIAFPNPGTSARTPFEVLRHVRDPAHFPAATWVSVANGVSSVFPDNSAEFVSQSVDTTNFWPIQRVVLRNARGLVHGGMQLRPGTDLVTFCQGVSGNEAPAAFDDFIRAVGTANDAALQAQAAQQEAEFNANQAAAAAAQAEQPQQSEENSNRRRRD